MDRRRLGIKQSLLVEGDGIPLGCVLIDINRHDSHKTRSLLIELGCAWVISTKGEPVQFGARWVVERTNSWSAGHLAAYAGIASVTRRSGSSTTGEFPARSGNKRLKNVLFYAAFAAIHCHPASRDYHAKKQAEDKKHNVMVIYLPRRRCNVIYTMLTQGELYREQPARTAA